MASITPTPEATDFQEDLGDDVWAVDVGSGPGLASRLVAELIGTFVLVFVGVGVAAYTLVLSPGTGGSLIVGLAFGIAVLGVIVAIGHVSGAHINPAVTLAFFASGRFPGRDVALYTLAQTAGAILAGGLVAFLARQFPAVTAADTATVMQQVSIGYGEHSPSGVGLTGALVAEFVVTGLLAAVVLSATSVRAPRGQAPFTIALGLVALVMLITPFTNGALNPARATGTAVFAGDWALSQLWAWWVITLAAGAVVGLMYRVFGPEEDIETVEIVQVIED